jgi:hypothetical protein
MKRGTGTMKKIALAGLIVVAASLVAVPSSDADSRRGHHRPHVHGRVFIGVGPAVWWGPYPYWYYPPPPYAVYAPPVVYAPPPPVVVPEPQVYIQQAPPPVAPGPSAQQFWYYCQSAQAYYPSVSSCPEAWVKVAPRP